MLRALLLTICFAATASAAPPAIDAHEPVWSGWLAEQLGGNAEATFEDDAGRGRVDIVTDRVAIEVEWPKTPKAPESLEQASRYGRAFDRKPVVIYLIGRGNRTVEKAIAATTLQFGKQWMEPRVAVLWFDLRDPEKSVEKLRERLAEIAKTPSGQDAGE